jgi:hypothetical protein
LSRFYSEVRSNSFSITAVCSTTVNTLPTPSSD